MCQDPLPIVRCRFNSFLSNYDHINVAKTAVDLKNAIAYIEFKPVVIVISEIILNDQSPIDFINKVKKVNPEVNVIFF